MQTYRKAKKHKTTVFLLAVLIFEFGFPHHVAAATTKVPEQSVMLPKLTYRASVSDGDTYENGRVVLVVPKQDNDEKTVKVENDSAEPALAPATKAYNVQKTYRVPITAYSSTPDQTWGDPCITANGFNVCKHNQEDVIAANFLPFGTKVMIPELFGDRIFIVQDRMNSRYYYRADIWMKTRQDAINFGIKHTTLVVVE